MNKARVQDIRQYFCYCKEHGYTVTNPRDGKQMLELIGASFIADEPSIFGEPNEEYINAEIDWYWSKSLNINDIYKGHKDPPKAWQMTANAKGFINSNYGWLIWSDHNFNQYDNVLKELKHNPHSRRATMIYQRPSIWHDHNHEGKNDFICTNAVAYYIRPKNTVIVDGERTESPQKILNCVVQMRSNDVVFGYKNDYAFQNHVLHQLAEDLEVEAGTIHWQVQNLHVYSQHFDLVK